MDVEWQGWFRSRKSGASRQEVGRDKAGSQEGRGRIGALSWPKRLDSGFIVAALALAGGPWTREADAITESLGSG